MRPPALRLRPARPSDAAQLARTMDLGFDSYRAFAPAAWTPPPNDPARLQARLVPRDTWCLVAEVAGEPAGHAAMFDDVGSWHGGYLWQLFVRPPWWGTGLAALLHDAVLEEAGERRYRELRLWTPAGHGRARRFYAARGWRTDGAPAPEPLFGLSLITLRRAMR